MIIGITGSSGAGKSTLCDILENKYHAKIISADKIAKELSKKGTKYFEEIVQNFGKEILQENGELNRQKLAYLIYNDKKQKEKLDKCTLKYIVEEIKLQVKNESSQIIAIDAPLLFEAGLDEICDITIAVVSKSKEAQIQRIVKRDKIDEKHAKSRIMAQQTNEWYMNKCKFTIINSGDVEYMEKQIDIILKYI